MRERFVKLNGHVYYESQLQLMSDNQLRRLVKECLDGIKEIELKSNDYRETNKDTDDIIHYQDVLNKFESATIYLQSDIVMIDKILKERAAKDNYTVTYFSEEEFVWLKKFYENAKDTLLSMSFKTVTKKTVDALGYSI